MTQRDVNEITRAPYPVYQCWHCHDEGYLNHQGKLVRCPKCYAERYKVQEIDDGECFHPGPDCPGHHP